MPGWVEDLLKEMFYGPFYVPLYGLPMFPSCRNTISVLNTQCI